MDWFTLVNDDLELLLNSLKEEDFLFIKVSLINEVLANGFQALLYDHRRFTGQVLGRMGCENSFKIIKDKKFIEKNKSASIAREQWKKKENNGRKKRRDGWKVRARRGI